MHLYKKFAVLICLLSITGCALRVPPTGGIKDAEAPHIVSAKPANNTVNFSSKKIEIEFDEYITLQDLNKQLVISPPLYKDAEIDAFKKTVSIQLPDSLKTNTTYTINFGNAVVDVHESTPAENLKYVFSTGAFIDSLVCKGRVYDAQTLKTEKGMGVYLYTNLADTIVYNTLPDYVAKTDEQGYFEINQLKPGTYKIFAHKDENNNYKFDSKTESIAFTNNINLPDSNLLLSLFTEPDTMPHLLKAQYIMHGKALITFTAPVSQFIFKPINNSAYTTELGFKKDSLIIYCADTLIDSVHAVIYNGVYLVDTIHVNLKPAKQKSGKSYIEPVFNLGTNLMAGVLEKGQTLMLYFDNPIARFDTTLVTLLQDSTSVIPFTTSSMDSLHKIYQLHFNVQDHSNYKLLLPKNCITDMFGLRNDSLEIAFKTRELTDYATIAIRTTFDNKINTTWLMVMLTESGQIVRTTNKLIDGTFVFENVLPGKYMLRLVADTNNNGRWDGGSYAQKQQPEKVYNFSDTINARSNWDVELNWIIK
ncbi:MAG: Ig-like domain-containing protein [Bacteroidia bacterium]|nr:Ig-like domain-containing protein [Bacteroidia bacterium]